MRYIRTIYTCDIDSITILTLITIPLRYLLIHVHNDTIAILFDTYDNGAVKFKLETRKYIRLTLTFLVLVNGGYTDWNNWTPCSVTCGKGIKTRQRFCTNPEPAYGGVACGHLGSGEESVQCYDVNCPGECLVYWQLSGFWSTGVDFLSCNSIFFFKGTAILLLMLYVTCLSSLIIKEQCDKSI